MAEERAVEDEFATREVVVKVRREAARAALARKDIIACVAGNEIEFLSLFADESGSKTDHEMLM